MIIQAKIDNLKEIEEIEKECFKHPFSTDDIYYELEQNPFAKVFILYDDEKNVVGYLDYWITFDSTTIARIAIKNSYKRMGYAICLLDFMEKELKKEKEKISMITLEVRASNIPAISLYLKKGFIKITTKSNYYTDGEDAIYMVKGV